MLLNFFSKMAYTIVSALSILRLHLIEYMKIGNLKNERQ
jgi:hypothetical protein